MFNLSGSEIIVILLLALVVLGPEKLPEAMRKAGRAYSELRKMANSFQSEVRSVIDEPMEELRGTADMLRDATNFSGDTKTGAATKPAAGVQATPAAAGPQPDPAAGGPEPVEKSPSTVEPIDGPDDALGAALDDEDSSDAAPEDLVTRTLSGDVEPNDSADEAGPNA